MILDGHIHIHDYSADWNKFSEALRQSGFDGGLVCSIHPEVHSFLGKSGSYQSRIENLISLAHTLENIYPFFWIDPAEKDALDQVDYAVSQGVVGFKVICSKFYPGEDFAMEVFSKIATTGKPILFHSGILGDNTASSEYCRPLGFEKLVEIENIKFSLAHIGWPWCDEVIALFGKIYGAGKHNGLTAEMYIDTTPGTPWIYRKDAFAKCFVYPVEKYLIFGSDSNTDKPQVDYAKSIVEEDIATLKELGKSDEVIDNVFHKNLLRFVKNKNVVK